MLTVVMTGAGGPAGRALAEQFAHRRAVGEQIRLIGTDLADPGGLNVDALVPVPRADDPEMVSALRDLAASYGADLVIPTVADELAVVAASTHAFAAAVVISGARATATCADKLLTAWSLERAGVPVPHSDLPSRFATADAATCRMGGPVVIKPRVGRGGRGVRVVEPGDGTDWSELTDDQVVQEFAPGIEYAAQVYRSPVDGEVTVVVLEKTALKNGRVGNALSVVRRQPGEASDVGYVAMRAAEALDVVGPLDLDIRRREDGTPVVLEVNARFGANSSHAPELLGLVLQEWISGTRPTRARSTAPACASAAHSPVATGGAPVAARVAVGTDAIGR